MTPSTLSICSGWDSTETPLACLSMTSCTLAESMRAAESTSPMVRAGASPSIEATSPDW